MAERIVEIEVSKSLLDATRRLSQGGDPFVQTVVREDVDRVVEALRSKGILTEGDDITVNFRANPRLDSSSPRRRVQVIQVFREGDNGKGSIDTITENYALDIEASRDN